jgi:HSP20 family molecular chaperone IbpA
MWFEALDRVSEGRRMHQQFFSLDPRDAQPAWEPPIDLLETEDEVLIFFALPGVDSSQVEASIEGSHLIVSGQRKLPDELRTALIHRMELPQGQFRRRVSLPKGVYTGVKRQTVNGCLLISLQKAARAG